VRAEREKFFTHFHVVSALMKIKLQLALRTDENAALNTTPQSALDINEGEPPKRKPRSGENEPGFKVWGAGTSGGPARALSQRAAASP
jgi:hypothetical protein